MRIEEEVTPGVWPRGPSRDHTPMPSSEIDEHNSLAPPGKTTALSLHEYSVTLRAHRRSQGQATPANPIPDTRGAQPDYSSAIGQQGSERASTKAVGLGTYRTTRPQSLGLEMERASPRGSPPPVVSGHGGEGADGGVGSALFTGGGTLRMRTVHAVSQSHAHTATVCPRDLAAAGYAQSHTQNRHSVRPHDQHRRRRSPEALNSLANPAPGSNFRASAASPSLSISSSEVRFSSKIRERPPFKLPSLPYDNIHSRDEQVTGDGGNHTSTLMLVAPV